MFGLSKVIWEAPDRSQPWTGLPPLALPARELTTKGSDKSCPEEPVNSMVPTLILAWTHTHHIYERPMEIF